MTAHQPAPTTAAILRVLESAELDNLVVHAVANGVRGDSRVLKSALVSIAEGLPTLVLGISSGPDFEHFEAEGVPVLLAPFDPLAGAQAAPSRASSLQSWGRRERDIELRRAGRAARTLRVRTLSRTLQGIRVGAAETQWSRDRPTALDINLALADVLDALQPSLIHVHDALPLPAATAHAARRRTRHRQRVQVLYDSHECLHELEKSYTSSPLYAALARIEKEYIHDVARVITVSPQIARVLKDLYRLRRLPTVVANGPNARRDLTAPSLRREIGLDPAVPLAVYSGWVAPERGLDTVLRALPGMPSLHLALVVNSQSRELLSVLRLANELGVLDRVHTAPYVTPSQITQYLSSADIGLIPLKSGGHLDLSLPTKFREYAHAGLPMVVSDNAAMAAEINRTKIGRVFKAGNVGGLKLQVERVLLEPDRYRNRITEELLDEYSWETQSGKLRAIYKRSAQPSGQSTTDAVAKALSAAVTSPMLQVESSVVVRGPVPQRSRANLYHVSLGVGRANSAGQAYAWANAVSTHLGVRAESFAPEHAICHPPDVAVRRRLTVTQAAAELGRICTQYTYLLVDGFESLFGPLVQGDLAREIEILQPHLFGIGLVAHGSEVRDPDRHARDVEGSFFLEADSVWVDTLREISSRNRGIARGFDGPVFVATPDLLEDLPAAHWLPVVVDVALWGVLPAPQFGRKLKVLHRPSRSQPPIKGSDIIHPVLCRLHAEGVIEYVHTDDLVNSEDMPELVARCDVVVDQIRTGSYGVAAVEAMAAGRIVVGSLTQAVRDRIEDEVPVVDAPPSELESVIRRLACTQRDDLAALADAGRDYAYRWHDGRRSSKIIEQEFLDDWRSSR
jgi:glycosyltransferase involved in cell wall biosynthesis